MREGGGEREREVGAYLTGQASVRSLCSLTEDGGCTEEGGKVTPE